MRASPDAGSGTDDTVHLTELLPDDTDTTREWLRSGTLYTTSPEQRTQVRDAIAEMHWQRPGTPMAMSPALLIQAVVAQMGLRLVAQVGYSIHEIRHPDCDPRCPNPDHPDHFASYSLIGIKVRRRDYWWTLYLLDVGVGASWLIGDRTPAPMPVKVSGACGMEWHDRCAGTFRQGEGRAVCQCPCPHPGAPTAEPSSTVTAE
jgi:hypothetical protein